VSTVFQRVLALHLETATGQRITPTQVLPSAAVWLLVMAALVAAYFVGAA